MNKILFFFLVFISLFFSSCSQTNKNIEVKKTNTYPSWYLKPYKDDQIYFYGVGIAQNIEQASKNALIDISSRLSIDIKSNSFLKTKSNKDFREYIQKEVKRTIISKTEELNFKNFEVFKTKKISYDKIAVLLRVSKKKFIKSLKTQITQELKQISIKYENLQEKDYLTKYLKLKVLISKLLELENKTLILSNLDKSFDENSFYKKLNKISAEILGLKEKIVFKVDKNKPLVKQYLNKQGFKTSNFQANYLVTVEDSFKNSYTRGFFLSSYSLFLEVIHKNKTLFSKNYTSKGISSVDYSDSRSNAIENLKIINLF